MKKDDITARLADFPFSTEDYWIITGAAMVLYGIREETADIDMGCTKDMADRLEADGFLDHVSGDGKRCFKYGDSIEIIEGWLRDSIQNVGGFPVVSIKGLVEMKRELGREKDRKDIRIIEAFLKRNDFRNNE